MWILFASLNPVSEAFRSLFAKKASLHVDSVIVSWFNNLFPLFVFTPLLFFVDLKLTPAFWYPFLATGTINVVATIFYMRAIAEGELSSVMPMLSFTPLSLLITGPVIVGEFPNTQGFIGIVLIVSGSYALNLSLKKKSWIEPMKSLLKNKGTRYMLFVAFVWSFSANFDKLSIQNSSLLQHIVFMNIFIFSSLTMYVILSGRLDIEGIKTAKKDLIKISLFTTGSFIFHMTALSLTLVVYVVALKRMSGILSVFIGKFFLGEGNIKERLTGSALMFGGALLIVMS